jgi:hypothetical protein
MNRIKFFIRDLAAATDTTYVSDDYYFSIYLFHVRGRRHTALPPDDDLFIYFEVLRIYLWLQALMDVAQAEIRLSIYPVFQ